MRRRVAPVRAQPFLAVLVLACALALPALATAAEHLQVQGVLRSTAGGPVADGTYGMAVTLYGDQGKTKLFEQLFIAVPVQGGLFAVTLGADPGKPLPVEPVVLASHVGVQVGAEPPLPQVALAAVPRAFHALQADTAKAADTAQFAQAAQTAVQADAAKTADSAKTADTATFAKSAENAAKATTAEEALIAGTASKLQCTGCVGLDALAPAVQAKLMAPATPQALGGVVVGDGLAVDAQGKLSVAGAFLPLAGGKLGGDLDLDGHEVLLLRAHNHAGPPVDCDAKRAGTLYFDTQEKTFFGCNGTEWASLVAKCAPGACADSAAASCKALLQAGVQQSGVYWLATGGAPFQAYCDQQTGGGGWTLCYTTAETVHVATETASQGTYGKDGYRANCADVPFTEVLYVHHAANQSAWFARDNGQPVKLSQTGYAVAGDALGTWSPAGGVAKAGKYQLNVCDGVSMWVGLMMTGYTNCWKQCGSWCGDESSPYFRTDGSDTGSYNGVAFNENGHTNVAGKVMSVGVR